MLKRIAITGPECTGKSWLAENLAKHYKTNFVPEFSIDYLEQHGAEYSLEDIVKIAKGQMELENKRALTTDRLLFCDTDLLVNKIWSKEVFGHVPSWIDEMIKNNHYSLYLLCAPDLKWKEGPFRENPTDRNKLFKLYENELLQLHFPYEIISGQGETRLKNAINFVDELL